MNSSRLDAVNKAVSNAVSNQVSRRGALRLLAGSALGGALAQLGLAEAAAQDAQEGETGAAAPPALEGEQLERLIQFVHPHKVFSYLPGFQDASVVAAMYGLDVATYQDIRARFEQNARQAAEELLADASFAQRVDRLPFQPESTVAVVSESSTDDLQSWLAILGYLLELRRPGERIRLLDEGISGRTTTQALQNFVPIVNRRPDWIVCFLGGNDAARYGKESGKTLVSTEETAKNFEEMRRIAEMQTGARWAWITMYPVDETRVSSYPPLQQAQLTLRNEDIAPINEIISRQPEPVVDLRPVFGSPPVPELLRPDGFHPSLAGHKAIVKAFVEGLAA